MNRKEFDKHKKNGVLMHIHFVVVLIGMGMLSSCDNRTDSRFEDIQSKDSLKHAKAALRFSTGTSSKDIQQLIQIIESTEDIGVRESCVDALGYAHATEAVPALIAALKIPEWRVRRGTTEALARIADPRAIDPLIEILTEDITDSNLSEGRRCAVYAFVNLKSEKVVPVLMHMLTHNPGRGESEKSDYTTAILAALGAQKDKRAIPVVADFLDGRAGVRAAGTIGAIVGEDFTDHGTLWVLPQPSPAKAKAWLQEHPELLEPEDNKDK